MSSVQGFREAKFGIDAISQFQFVFVHTHTHNLIANPVKVIRRVKAIVQCPYGVSASDDPAISGIVTCCPRMNRRNKMG